MAKDKKTRPISIRLPEDLLADFKERARVGGVPYQRLIREALEQKRGVASEPVEVFATAITSRRSQGSATADDIRSLPDDNRVEVIGGELVEKQAARFSHGGSQLALGALLGDFFLGSRGGDRPGGWWLAAEVHVEFKPSEIYIPDVTGWRRDRVPEPPSEWPVRTRPDWVCEILSRSTAKRDLVVKPRTLHESRVPHYWVLDLDRGTLAVHRWQPRGYMVVLTASSEETVRAEPFDAIEFRVGRALGRE